MLDIMLDMINIMLCLPHGGKCVELYSVSVCSCRHNPRWGKHAPTRLYSKRSTSDPDIMQSLEKEELERRGLQQRAGTEEGMGVDWEGENGGDTHFRPIHNVVSAYNIPHLLLQQTEEPELNFLAEEEVTGSGVQPNLLVPVLDCSNPTITTAAAQVPGAEGGGLVHSTPVDKRRSLQSFLAFLPVVVGGSTDDGIGENIPTSNSGSAYSSPMYTPPDEESIHLHMAAQLGEQEEAREAGPSGAAAAGEEALESSGEGRERGRVGDEESRGQGVSEATPPPRSPPRQLTSSPSTAASREHQGERITINNPVTPSHRSHSVPQALSGYVIRGDGSTTPAKKPTGSSPTNCRGHRGSGLLRQSPVAAMPEDAEEREVGRERRQGSPSTETQLQGDRGEVQSDGEPATERKWPGADSVPENMTPRTRERFMHHRRTKSDSHHDISGPIKTPQISSVPERVKEIEEKGLQVTGTQSLQSINQVDCQRPPSVSSSTNSRSSSEECLASHFTDTAGDRGKCSTLQHFLSSRAPANSLARHTSLSPRPSLLSCAVSSFSSPHLPVQTSFSLPSSVSPPDPENSSSPPPTDPALTSSLHGVVKAKVQDIEGKKGTQQAPQQSEPRSTGQSEPRSTGSDTVVKRSLVQSGQRPQSEIIFHSPYVGVVEVNDPSDSESQTSTTSSSREVDGGGSSLFQTHHRSAFSTVRGQEGSSSGLMGRRNTSCDLFSRSEETQDSRDTRVQSGAVFNAWIGMIPAEELQSNDMASVLELRQKFERESPKDPRRGLQQLSSLRRSRSLRDTRLTSPPVRLGGSGRWKKCSSNANLQRSGERHHRRVCASASPTASGSQLSLSSSGKM